MFNSKHSCNRLPLYILFVGEEKVMLVFGLSSDSLCGGVLVGVDVLGAQGVGVGVVVGMVGLCRFLGDFFLNLPRLISLSFCICRRRVVGEVV